MEATLRASAWILPAALELGRELLLLGARGGRSGQHTGSPRSEMGRWMVIALSLLLSVYHVGIGSAPLVCLHKRRCLRVLAGLLPVLGPPMAALENEGLPMAGGDRSSKWSRNDPHASARACNAHGAAGENLLKRRRRASQAASSALGSRSLGDEIDDSE